LTLEIGETKLAMAMAFYWMDEEADLDVHEAALTNQTTKGNVTGGSGGTDI
jgi:hypothetical protein